MRRPSLRKMLLASVPARCSCGVCRPVRVGAGRLALLARRRPTAWRLAMRRCAGARRRTCAGRQTFRGWVTPAGHLGRPHLPDDGHQDEARRHPPRNRRQSPRRRADAQGPAAAGRRSSTSSTSWPSTARRAKSSGSAPRRQPCARGGHNTYGSFASNSRSPMASTSMRFFGSRDVLLRLQGQPDLGSGTSACSCDEDGVRRRHGAGTRGDNWFWCSTTKATLHVRAGQTLRQGTSGGLPATRRPTGRATGHHRRHSTEVIVAAATRRAATSLESGKVIWEGRRARANTIPQPGPPG